jgi:hypothetical protein
MSNTTIQLNPEDRARMHKLYEEVTSRLQEMSMISTRSALGSGLVSAKLSTLMKSSTSIAQFTPVDHKVVKSGKGGTGAPAIVMKGIEIKCFGSGAGMCLCYDYDEGTCGVC